MAGGKKGKTLEVRDLVIAAGGIVRRADGRILLVHRLRYDDWSLPKGKLDDGESPLETALREVREETGWTCRTVQFVGAFGYEVKMSPKVVLYWLMEPLVQAPVEDIDEVAAIEWLTPEEAAARLSYPLEKELVIRAIPR